MLHMVLRFATCAHRVCCVCMSKVQHDFRVSMLQWGFVGYVVGFCYIDAQKMLHLCFATLHEFSRNVRISMLHFSKFYMLC